jgi:hypothetical protein
VALSCEAITVELRGASAILEVKSDDGRQIDSTNFGRNLHVVHIPTATQGTSMNAVISKLVE